MRNELLLAELRRRRMYDKDHIYDQILAELATLYATIAKMDIYTQRLEKEAAEAPDEEAAYYDELNRGYAKDRI